MKGKSPNFDHLSHGGNRRAIAAESGFPEKGILDYSANINPFGPPPWLGEAIAEGALRIASYPDPDATSAREAAALRFSADPDHFLFADGADSLLFSLPLALKVDACVVASPTYSGYRRAALRAGVPEVAIPLSREEGFSLSSERFLGSLRGALEGQESPAPAGGRRGSVAGAERGAGAGRFAVFLGAPNNPIGGALSKRQVEEFSRGFPRHFFVIDESFLELSGSIESLIGSNQSNIIVTRSLTKAWAVPGARIGFMYAAPEICSALRAELPAWPVSSFAEAIARRALGDFEFLEKTVPALQREEALFSSLLGGLPGFTVFRSGANFLLVDFGSDVRGKAFADELLKRGIAVRRFGALEGLGPRYARLAVRSRAENLQFTAALDEIIAIEGQS